MNPASVESKDRSLSPLIDLARREAGRLGRQTALTVVAVALPVGFAAFVGMAFVSPSPISVMFMAVLAAVIALSVGAVLSSSIKHRVVRYARLSAIGADPGQIRTLLLFESIPAVLAGYLLGFTIGTIASYSFGPLHLLTEDGASIGVSVPVLILLAALAVGASTALGLWLAVRPAAAMTADTSVLDALAARSPEPDPRPNQGRLGLGLIVAALAMATVGADFIMLTLAVIAVFVGLHLTMAPALLWLQRHSARFPRPLRLAVRNGARNRTRLGYLTLASLATAALGVMGAAGIQSDSPDNPASGYSWPMDGRFLFVANEGTVNTQAVIRQTVDVAAEVEVRLVDANVVRTLSRDTAYGTFGSSHLAILTPELAAVLEPDAETLAALDRGELVAADGVDRPISVDGGATDLDTHVTRLGFGSVRTLRPTNRWPSGPFGPVAPNGLISPERMADLGLDEFGLRLRLMVADRPLNDGQRQQLADRGARSIIVATDDDIAENVDRAVTAIAAVFMIGFGLIGAALSGFETEDEIQVMIANGAAPSIRRWFRAAQSGLQLGLAGLVGVPLGLILFWAVTRSDQSVPDPIFPWETMIGLGLVAPIVTVALVVAVTGSGKPAVSRRAMA